MLGGGSLSGLLAETVLVREYSQMLEHVYMINHRSRYKYGRQRPFHWAV